MVNLEELLNRRPNRWGNLTIKEFERDIKRLQETCRMYESAIAEDDATKTRLLTIIKQNEKKYNELAKEIEMAFDNWASGSFDEEWYRKEMQRIVQKLNNR